MAAEHNNFNLFQALQSPGSAMPLNPLSPERVNANHPTPANDSPKHAPTTSPSEKQFGHPELGPPGDFSKFSPSKSSFQAYLSQTNNDSSSGGGSDSDHKLPISPVRFGQSMFSQISGNGSKKLDISNWSPSRALHTRTSSEVQSMVARFNSLDIRDHVEMRKKEAAALRRAQMGREEAEEDARRLKEDARAMRKEIEEAKDRERRVAKRVDVLMEDLHRSKETQAHAQTLYEKEIKKARKEAFKASSTMLKLQEELKTARKALGVVQSDLDLERIKYAGKEQDAFAAQYQLVGVQQELEQAQSRVNIAEEERNVLKTLLKEEEVARIAAEGRIPLPAAEVDEDDEFASPRKQRAPQPSPIRELPLPRLDTEHLRSELEHQIQRTRAAEEQVDFMKMECQFGCCSCRTAERQEITYIHDGSFEAQIQKFKDAIAAVLTPPPSDVLDIDMEPVPEEVTEAAAAITVQPSLPATEGLQQDLASALDFPTTHSMLVDPAVVTTPQSARSEGESQGYHETSFLHHLEPENELKTHMDANAYYNFAEERHSLESKPATGEKDLPNNPSSFEGRADSPSYPPATSYYGETEEYEQQGDQTDGQSYDEYESYRPNEYNGTYRTVTTTTTVPLVDASSTPDYRAFFSPMTLTREEAIEQLRLRRGRARSAAGTPRKPLVGDDGPARRDISAPEVKGKTTPNPGSKGRDWRR